MPTASNLRFGCLQIPANLGLVVSTRLLRRGYRHTRQLSSSHDLSCRSLYIIHLPTARFHKMVAPGTIWSSGTILSRSPLPPSELPLTSVTPHPSRSCVIQHFAHRADHLAAVGMATGAFGAHGLRARNVPDRSIASWMTGSQYLIYNGLALMAISLHPRLSSLSSGQRWKIGTGMIVGGALTFSGTIFGLVLAREKVGKVFGPLTPVGGAVMMAG